MAKSMQFFFRDRREEAEILRVLGNALGFIVESTDVRFEGAVGLLQVDEYEDGFNQGCLVSWPDSVVWQGDEREVARKLAEKMGTHVLLEMADKSGQWLLILPTTEQRVVSVVMLDDGIDTADRL